MCENYVLFVLDTVIRSQLAYLNYAFKLRNKRTEKLYKYLIVEIAPGIRGFIFLRQQVCGHQ